MGSWSHSCEWEHSLFLLPLKDFRPLRERRTQKRNRLHGPGGVSPLSPPTDGQLYSDKAGPPALMEGHLGVKGGGGMAQGMVEGCHLCRVGERVKGR